MVDLKQSKKFDFHLIWRNIRERQVKEITIRTTSQGSSEVTVQVVNGEISYDRKNKASLNL